MVKIVAEGGILLNEENYVAPMLLKRMVDGCVGMVSYAILNAVKGGDIDMHVNVGVMGMGNVVCANQHYGHPPQRLFKVVCWGPMC
jgi:hypothetical protein